MKTSVQVLAGIVTGLLLALFLPVNSFILELINTFSTIVLSIGRYLVLPLLFFSLIISVTKLKREKILFKNFIILLGITALFSLGLVLMGIVASLIFSPGQIPVVIDGLLDINIPGLLEIIRMAFPENIFTVFQGDFTTDANQFIPFFALAIILGIFFTISSREEIEPAYNLADSLSRIFFKINSYFIKICYLWVTILTVAYITTVKGIMDLEIFLPLIYMLLIITAIILFIIYPIIFYYTCGKRNVFKYLILKFPSLAISAITQDLFFTESALIDSQKRDFKIKREYSGFNIPFLTLFSKAGTAMITVITFIVILKSYSSLEITVSQVLWVAIMSFLISFCLPTKATGSSVASLYLICSLYPDAGMVDSFIILSPAFPVICAITTLLNTGTIILINLIMDPEKTESN